MGIHKIYAVGECGERARGVEGKDTRSRLSPYYMDKNPCFPVAHGPVSLHGLYYTDSPWEEG